MHVEFVSEIWQGVVGLGGGECEGGLGRKWPQGSGCFASNRTKNM